MINGKSVGISLFCCQLADFWYRF